MRKIHKRLALGLALLLGLAAYGSLLHPSALPLRLIEACAPVADAPAGDAPIVTLGDETRPILGARTPWRCEISLVPDPRSELALAFPSGAKDRAVGLRVTFETITGGTHLLYEGKGEGDPAGPGWRDLVVPLSSLPRLRGRLALASDPNVSPGAAFTLAEPVIYRPRKETGPNLLLVVLDAMRADRMGYAGYERPVTPRLDALAAEGTVLENLYAPTSWTRPAAATLLTGLALRDHGVHTPGDRLGAPLVTLAERMRRAGYATSGLSDGPDVRAAWGFAQGFERFVEAPAGNPGRRDGVSRLVDLALDEIARIRHRPFFLYLHVDQIQAPYLPPAEHLAAGGGGRGARDRYDGEIRFTDAELGRLWDGVSAMGLADRTLLVVVGDHGEEFGEHGGVGHGRTLYEEVLRVPAFFRFPGKVKPRRRVKRTSGLAAISPAVLNVLGIAAPDAPSSAPLLESDPAAEETPLAFRLERDRQLAYGLRRGPWKYVRTVYPAGREELFDLSADPGERRNLAGEKRELREEMARLLDQRLSAGRPGLHVRLSAGEKESRRMRVTLRTTGRISNVLPEGLEPGDTAVLGEDGRALTITTLAAGRRPGPDAPGQGSSRRLPDVDEVTVRLDPPESDVHAEVIFLEGTPPKPLTPPWLGAAKAPADIRFPGETASLAVPAVTVESMPGGRPPVWIYVVPDPGAENGKAERDTGAR